MPDESVVLGESVASGESVSLGASPGAGGDGAVRQVRVAYEGV